eukprot:CAMPEP_0176126974 /NCGR_PEP_ID=MMETSP0120_2-20121206/64102_1 /TAXON_ID=160619 /ORGANISM="Kryptoperidinium foliaceum, Strain CCMP 1326" /LENGTH=53 /DNA_ID=CAMNT_0017461937 /DNA_START=44 /DNA_END=205 /DNA_ORIENTATION=+
MKQVQEAMLLAPTSVRDHRQSIQNFDEVAQALKGTDFAALLRDGGDDMMPATD